MERDGRGGKPPATDILGERGTAQSEVRMDSLIRGERTTISLPRIKRKITVVGFPQLEQAPRET